MSLLSEMQRHHHLVVRALDTKGDPKAARAETAAIAYETGRIWHPGWSPSWLEGFEKELLQFDKGAHDDQVDVISYAARDLLRGVLSQGREKKKELPWDGTNTRHLAEMRKSSRHKKKRHHPILGRF
jgi:phage terminase large subunit-like protein